MVWVYDSPLNTSEQKVYKVLKRKLKAEDIAKTTVKILSLYAFLKSQKFSSAKEIRESAFLDKQKTLPVFTEEQAKSVLKSLKKRGGFSKYPFTDHVAKKGITVATTYIPDSVKGTFDSIYNLVTSPVRLVEENIPFGDLLLGMIHGATETGVTVAGDVAEGVGGPVGAAFLAPFTAMAAALASLISLGQKDRDFGQAVAHLANAVPVMGSALGKGLTQMEHQVENLKKHPEVAEYVPVVGEYITGRPTKSLSDLTANLDPAVLQQNLKDRATAELQKRGVPTSRDEVKNLGMTKLAEKGVPTSLEQVKSTGLSEIQKRVPTRVTENVNKIPPELISSTTAPTAAAAGGKRFSTQRRKYSKWPKTRRSKSAKV